MVAGLIALYALVYGTFVWIKYRNYLYSDFDLAIFVQATDRLLHGSLYTSIRGMNWLGDHVSLILFVIAPLYALVRHPLTLLFLQTAVLALGAWPVAALARRTLGHGWIAAALAALYLLHPALGYTNLFEFHPEVLATTTLLATMACMAAERFGWTLAFATLSVLCKEDVALPVLMLGLTALLPGRRRRYAAALAAVAVASLLVSFVVIKPRFASSAADYAKMYHDWGGSAGQVALHILRDPLRAVASFVSTPGDALDTLTKRLYWPMMLGPFLLLPLLAPATFAVALPVLAEHFLSFRIQQHGLIYQYTALVTPVFAAAAVGGLATLIRLVTGQPPSEEALRPGGRARRLAFGVVTAALVVSLAANLLYGVLLAQGWVPVQGPPERNVPDLHDRTLRPHRDRMIAAIPREGGVVAGFEFLARLARRPVVHSLHHVYAGYFTFSDRPYPVPEGIDAFIGDLGDARLTTYIRASTALRMRRLMEINRLRPVDAAGDLLLFERDARDTVDLFTVDPPPPRHQASITYDGQIALAGWSLQIPPAAPGGLLEIGTCWRRVETVDRQFMIQLVVMDASGHIVFGLFRHLGYLFYPASEWPRDRIVRETYRLPIPADLPPGTYALGMRIGWWREPLDVNLAIPDDAALAAGRQPLNLGTFTVAPRP
ncbi:MAG: DUF2079 domain-containing protein [Candidatus Eisenbacteria bacterium]|nr:DUF2079 domain-containing protein [Candidatus Eisenbacteria bacterium]